MTHLDDPTRAAAPGSGCEAGVMSDALRSELAAIVGPHHVLTEPDVRAGHETDWTGRWSGNATAVVRPADEAEVAAVLRTCNDRDVHVIPQAGNTGLVGGSVPRRSTVRPQIVLSLARLDELGPCDPTTMQVTVGAGVTIAAWQAHARAAGLDTPVDFAARDSATVGGAIATNAGGSRVVRYGTMRSQVCGIRALLADGTVVGALDGLPKETAGIHWPSLLTGSEGTLAVVTAARLRLVPRFEHTVTALVTMGSLPEAVGLLGALRTGLPSLDAVEVMSAPAVELVARHLGVTPPATTGGASGSTDEWDEPDRATLLVECADHVDPSADLAGVVESAPGVLDAVVAADGPRRRALTALRDRMTEAIAAAATASGGPVFKLDVAVPVDRLDELWRRAHAAASDDGARLIAFGHLAEGNLHLNHLDANDTDRLAAVVLQTVADLGGTISAEHGIGVAKAGWLPLIRQRGDLEAQRAVRRALDPRGILNPGVLDPFGVERPDTDPVGLDAAAQEPQVP